MRHLRHLFLGLLHESVGGEKLKLEGVNELEMITGFNSLVDDITHLLKLPKLRVLEGRIFYEECLSMIVDHILNHQEQFRDVNLNIYMGVNMDSEDGSTLLKRIAAWDTRIEEDPMKTLDKLPMLRVVRLRRNPYVGREMVCEATGFPQLRGFP
ncbi:putative disease resistance protein At1g59780 [Sesamum indicum]|uniref:Disease resistance protein At1g59780 n=1 Tax=Sesamum indicum TaxID=4182 RepID=A0A6I9T4F0_SESIN|nr:putative disease resistance protein At1g59780 [Sesamum indicum]